MGSNRVCQNCNQEKALDEFELNGKYRRSTCRACRREQAGENRAKDRESIRAKAREGYRKNREKILESQRRRYKENPEAREKIRRQQLEYHEKNREKILARQRAYHVENRDKILEWHREYRKKNPGRMREWHQKNPNKRSEYESRRRAKRRGAERAEAVDREYIIARDQSKCHICGKKVPRSEIHLDHLVPLSAGGDHIAANLRVAHAVCNMSRGPGRIPAQLLLVG